MCVLSNVLKWGHFHERTPSTVNIHAIRDSPQFPDVFNKLQEWPECA